MIGCIPKVSRQEKLHGLPELLLPEEVALLLEKKLARLLKCNNLNKPPTKEQLKNHQEHRKKMFNEVEECLREEKIKSIESHMDRIIEGKKRKIMGLNVSKKKMKQPLDESASAVASKIKVDRDTVMAEEISKIQKLDGSEAIVHTPTAHIWNQDDKLEEAHWNYPETSEEKIKYMIFKDLWERGHYVTTGGKFGGDFLAYPGDPTLFHSQYVINYVDRNEDIPVIDLAGQCRLSTHVRKTQVYAYLTEDKKSISYLSFNWGGAPL